MNINPSALPDDSDQLKRMLLDFQDHHDKETDILLEQNRHLRAQLFGRKSEKTPVEGGPVPLPLFDINTETSTQREPCNQLTRDKGFSTSNRSITRWLTFR